MTLNIVQPIATIHEANGALKAIRVFKAKIECDEQSIIPSQLRNKKCIRYADLYRIKLLNCLEKAVVEVSMQDISKDRRLRSMITCKPDTIPNNKDATIRGTFAMPAIKADGAVVNPDIYQIIGSKVYWGAEGIRVTNAFFVDYAGNCYTTAQLLKKAPALNTVVQDLTCSKALEGRKEYELLLTNDKTQGIGNAVLMNGWCPIACMSYKATDYAVSKYAAALSAGTLCQQLPSEQRAMMYNSALMKNVLTYWLLESNIAEMPIVHVPYGFESVVIKADRLKSLKTLVLASGVACLEMCIAAVPQIVAETPLFAYAVRAEQSEQSEAEFPVIQGVAEIPLRTRFTYIVKQQKYISRPISLINRIYDADCVTVDLETQWCSALTLPLTRETMFCMPVDTKSMGIVLQPVQSRMLPVYKGKYTAILWLKLQLQQMQNILLKLQGDKKSELQCVFSYDVPEEMRERENIIQRRKQLAQTQGTPQSKMVTVMTSATVQKMTVALEESMNLHVMNEAKIGAVQITYSHCINEWQDISSLTFAEGVGTIAIHVGACISAKHTVNIPYVTDKIIILLSDVNTAHAYTAEEKAEIMQRVHEAANALDIHVAQGPCEIALCNATGNVLKKQYADVFKTQAVHTNAAEG